MFCQDSFSRFSFLLFLNIYELLRQVKTILRGDMGGKQSKDGSYVRRNPSSRISQSGSSNYGESSFSAGAGRRREMHSEFGFIGDNYRSLDQVRKALLDAGLESSNLIVGIDFTKSNEHAGKNSFNGKSLHHISETLNPYEHAISIIGRTLSPYDEDNLIPCFGFGDVSTHDQDVFSFYQGNRPCNGFGEALSRYKEIVPNVRLAGPTSFAPIIETAIGIVDQSGGQYHVLLIIADGQVTRSVDTKAGKLSPQEQSTVNAIVKASKYALSIIVVGVGDGPWDMMHEFDDNIPARDFDNIQFVNFTEIMSINVPLSQKETEFALAALMEIPLQYRATLELHLLGKQIGNSTMVPLPPPTSRNPRPQNMHPYPARNMRSPNPYSNSSRFPSFASSRPSSPSPSEGSSSNRNCPVCEWSKRDLVLGCGHQTCSECGHDLVWCPICRTEITNRIRLYD
ncbi:hypothetical protein ACP275_13G127000 [Erythranthe tilingii]